MKPANDRKFVTVYEPHYKIDEPGAITMAVRIDTLSDNMNQLQPIMIGIVEGVKEYIAKEKAKEIFAGIEAAVKEQVEIAIKEYVKKECYVIASKLDVDTLAKLAAIGAAKDMGKEIVK